MIDSVFELSERKLKKPKLISVTPTLLCFTTTFAIILHLHIGETKQSWCHGNQLWFLELPFWQLEDWVDQFSSFNVVSLGPVVSSSSLSKCEVVLSEVLSELLYWIIILVYIYSKGWSRLSYKIEYL